MTQSTVDGKTPPEDIGAREAALLAEHQGVIWKRTDRLFAGLLIFEWIGGIVLALWLSPFAWEGTARHIHPHVFAAIFLGALIVAFPIYRAIAAPGTLSTRHIIAVSQMLYSALLIHLGGGRIEMHFHVFGSLAFLAFYRDWRVLVTASIVVALDHLLRGLFLPESVYGVLTTTPWRTVEHAAWVVFEDIFLLSSCVQGVSEMRGIAQRQALLEQSHRTVEEKVRERTRQLKDAQDDLLKVARSAGMAEIATSVLHNVGNVLNSVNVSVDVARDKVRQSPVQNLSMAIDMMNQHKDDLGGFLSQDERGRQIPGFLQAVAEVFSSEQTALLDEMNSLAKNVDHIKQIVSVQQSNAKAANVTEEINVGAILQDAIRVNGLSIDRSPIEVVVDLQGAPVILADKHVILQILINLLSNAKHAVSGNSDGQRRITLRTVTEAREGTDWLRIDIVDTGVGIAPENITRIFSHGFTTRKEGHGFGLHASANSARQMGGNLTARSDGPGQGATFTLHLPLKLEQVTA